MSAANSQLESKLKDLQQYLPFLQSVIDKLRSNNEHQKDNPRKAQLMKMEMLQDLLTNKSNKLKMDTLLKCEGVLIKLHAKIEQTSFLQNENDISKPSHITNTSKQNSDKSPIASENKESKVEIIDITGPESPPPQPVEEVEPVEIPTERRCSPVDIVEDATNEKQRQNHKKRHHIDERRINHQHNEKAHHQNRNTSHGKSNERSRCEKSIAESTTVTSTRTSNVSIQDDYNLGSSRSPSRSQNATCSFLQNRKTESTIYVRRQTGWDDGNLNSNDVYSPEECWDELTSKQKTDSPAVILQNSPSSPICGAEVNDVYHDTIFNFKKQTTQKTIFTRLGEKIDTAKPFENFKVSVQNEQSLVKTCQRKPVKTPIASTPVKVPTIPEVLKSPPLSANDISDLLNDSIDQNNVSDICEIGTRRPTKTNLNPKVIDAKTSDLDMVRKKFAMVTKGSPQIRNSPDQPRNINTNPSPIPNERLALKYNPHPRIERNVFALSQSGNEKPTQKSCKPSDPRLNSALGNLNTPSVPKMNAISSVKPQDPRLRKSAAVSVPPHLPLAPHVSTMPHIAPLLPTTPIMGSGPLIRTAPSVTNFQMRSYSASSLNFRPGATLMSSYHNPQSFTKSEVQQFVGSNQYADSVLFSRRKFHGPELVHHYQLNTQQNLNIPAESVADKSASEDNVNFTTKCKNLTGNEGKMPASKKGYSSEENWDSEPEEVPAQEKIGFPKSKNYESLNSETNICRKTAFEKKASHNASVFTSTSRPRFSAVLNDKSERIKYFESKKQKHAEPHTYAEYKKAKARVAAEEAAKKLTEPTAKIAGENPVLSDSKTTAMCKTTESTLDKRYRDSNFRNCEFPKTKTSFKIPKKQQETVTTKNEETFQQDRFAESKKSCKKPESVSKEPILNDKMLQMDNKDNPVTKENGKKEKCPKFESKPDENKQGQTVISNSRKQTSKEVAKVAKTKENIAEVQGGERIHISKPNKINKENSATLKCKESIQPKVTKKVSADFEQKTLMNDGSVEINLNVGAVSTEGPVIKLAAHVVNEIVLSSSEDEKLSSVRPKLTDGIIKSNEELKTSISNSNINIGRPARILQRRNTMFVQGSIPLVDKEKILSATALVFEDIQDNERLRSRADIDLKQTKKNRTLASIFQKTSDNCTVSTQNIISGKRRTRTTVNFNEVQRGLEVFQHKKPREPRKEVDTEVTKKSSPKAKQVSNTQMVDGAGQEQIQIHKKNKSSTDLDDDYENQNCAVSSTTFHLEEEVADTLAIRKNKLIAENVCEPSSSTVKTMNATSTTDDDKKAALLEGFVQDILKPNANTEYIFSLLRQILSDEKLKLVKEIVESAAKENAKDVRNDDFDNGEFELQDEKEAEDGGKSDKKTTDNLRSLQGKEQVPSKKAPKRKAKRNELDRLNEDIRDMFISKGVLTATGRRMCTLVAAEQSTDNTVNDTPPRGMPILKAHTPIKQSDVEDHKLNSNIKRQLSTKKRKVQVKLAKIKSAPKCVTSVQLCQGEKENEPNKEEGEIKKSNNTAETTKKSIDIEIVTSTSENSISPSSNQNSDRTTVQRELQPAEELRTNANIFMPTREANDSPTMNNFTQSLLTIENEQAESFTTSDHNGISIAERLSQRFRDLQERSVRSNVVTATEKHLVANEECNNTISTDNDIDSSSNVYKSTSATEKCFITEVSSQSSSALNKSNESEGCLVIADNDTDVSTELAEKHDIIGDSNSEDDEDKWEDIEITESAPSTTSSIVSTSSGISKASRGKNKTVYHKFNRLYASNNKLKKSLSITMGNKKKLSDKSVEQIAPVSITTASRAIAEPTVGNNDNLGQALAFRPIISNLADLLPDSPCNDPIELVPELTPLAPLQDLNDISSILDSDYMSNMYFPHTAASINIDHQQTSIQEALDFVSEQENQLHSNTHLSSSGGQNIQTQASINRVENIGYAVSSDESGFKFYCLSEKCTFIYSSEAIGLEVHFLNEHPHTLWRGYCHTCKTQVNTDCELTLSAELKHMHEKHTNSSTSASTEKLLPQSVLLVNPEERPRIKIRRLTGDCLSSTPTPTSASGSSIDENTNPLPPTKVIPPCSNNCIDEPLFRNATNELWITSVTSGATTPTCQLQIASVVSLNEECKGKGKVKDHNFATNVEKSVQIPKISNVCSLNGVEKRSVSCSKLIENEQLSLNSCAAESVEVSRILDKESSIKKTTVCKVTAVANSPEPQVVAETVPVAQATTGEYLITQTVSAQYEEGRPGAQLGFNISIATNPSVRSSRSNCGNYSSSPTDQATSTSQERSVYKCMGGGCKYQTRVPVAMRDHLQFHDRHNFANKRDYLCCSFCSNTADDIKGYFEHLKTTHTNCNIGALTQTMETISNSSNCEGNKPEQSADTAVPITSNTNAKKETKSLFIDQLRKTIDEMVATTGIEDSKLYGCAIDGCKVSLTESNYLAHIAGHVSTLRNVNAINYSYKCPHCAGSYRQCKIKMHIKSHARHRYFCYLCRNTAINADQILKHFKDKHWSAKNMYSAPLIKTENKDMLDVPKYYVAYSQKLTETDVQQFGEKLIMDWMRKKEGSRTHFKPNEIALLPLTPIFQKELNCAICAYKTKVRTNLLRHLQLHSDENSGGGQQVANVDPVNPVPCLNTNEKHFDKMTNLASSSLTTGGSSGAGVNANSNSNPGSKPCVKMIYDYVSETKRYTCGVSGCQYLTISDDIFRSHLNALHTDISNYKCPLCKEEICKRSISVERILQHLRFHGKKLYQCEECDYLHYMKNVVERHIHDKHPTMHVNLITYDRTNSTTGEKTKEQITSKTGIALFDATVVHSKTETVSTKSKQKWLCNICGHKAVTQQQMVTHCSTQHSSKHQYQCTHCSFGAAQLSHIMSHIDEKHVGKMREVRYVFHKIAQQNEAENDANTRPLWQRDDPTRVRHIRGILMEDEEESEQYRKRLCLDEDSETSAINDETNKSHVPCPDNSITSSYEFGCFYCHNRFTNLNDLRNIHWKSVHGIRPEITNPFQYYLIKLLKCSECQMFVGSWHELQLHLKSVHNSNRYIALDTNASSTALTCGYCDFSCQTAEQLVKHNRRLSHKLSDIKGLNNFRLKDILKLGIAETYLQCSMCLDIFANRTAIVAHASSAHVGEEGFCFRELTGKLIYRCTKCVYTSTHELTTLRHMIDHYEGFKRCHFCHEPQTAFNGYMQHCYSDHREAIKQFSEIYPFEEIKKFLQDMQILFPNGLLISVHNLQHTQHNGIVRIKQLYEEICKTSQQPPIPRLSIARLVASKSYEGKKSGQCSNPANLPDDDNSQSSASASTAAAMQLAGNGGKNSLTTFAAKRILKRRSTVAHGSDEIMANLFNNKKRRLVINSLVLPPPKPKTDARSRSNSPPVGIMNAGSVDGLRTPELQPLSFYGQPEEVIDLNKVYTRIAIAGVDTRVNIVKFKMLCKIDAHVVLEKVNLAKFGESRIKISSSSTSAMPYENVKKACPASQKYKYVKSSSGIQQKKP